MERTHAKYQKLLDFCKTLPPTPTAVAHPCDESSLRGAVDAGQLGLKSLGEENVGSAVDLRVQRGPRELRTIWRSKRETLRVPICVAAWMSPKFIHSAPLSASWHPE